MFYAAFRAAALVFVCRSIGKRLDSAELEDMLHDCAPEVWRRNSRSVSAARTKLTGLCCPVSPIDCERQG